MEIEDRDYIGSTLTDVFYTRYVGALFFARASLFIGGEKKDGNGWRGRTTSPRGERLLGQMIQGEIK